jgi:prepilin-type N-terminal cleavage/methylation domain-containing protein
MKKSGLNGQAGFSLIELLTVSVVVTSLAAIAIPQFGGYRKHGYEATLKADLRNAAVAEEAYFAQNLVYKTGPLSTGTLAGYNKSAEISSIQATAGVNTFQLTATHTNCPGITWTYSNVTGISAGPSC